MKPKSLDSCFRRNDGALKFFVRFEYRFFKTPYGKP